MRCKCRVVCVHLHCTVAFRSAARRRNASIRNGEAASTRHSVLAISIVIGCDDDNNNRWITLLVKHIRFWQSEMSRRKPPKAITLFAPNLLHTVSHRVAVHKFSRERESMTGERWHCSPALKHFQLKIFKSCSRLWVTARNMDRNVYSLFYVQVVL